MKSFIRNTVFFIGWLLSPLTFWNDAFINIPISYLAASLLIKVLPVKFLYLVLISYWFSNVLGLYMMYLSGSDIYKSREGVFKGIKTLIITTTLYSLILVALARTGILRPF